MPWREAFTQEDIQSALERCGLPARACSYDDQPTTHWEFDWDMGGDIEVLTPDTVCSFAQIARIVEEFKPDLVMIDALNVTLPPDGRTRIGIKLIWNKE